MVILFSIDGMRPDGLLAAETPNMDRLMKDGATTLTAQTVMPCCTLPCHTSMHRGVDATRHGIWTNTFQPLVRPVPSVFDVANAHGLRCGFFYNWGQLRDLCDPESLVVSHYCRDSYRPEGDDKVAEASARYIKSEKLDFAFVYLGYTDECGHKHGWMSPEYIAAISNADRCIGEVLEVAANATVLVMSDHGGHERTHGTELPEDMTIPWILSGPGVRRGVAIQTPVVIYDTAPTLAYLLGLTLAREWDGRVIDEALTL
jgi:predicted AlkP superfamily pyrophosphatase or phosphodiesterase